MGHLWDFYIIYISIMYRRKIQGATFCFDIGFFLYFILEKYRKYCSQNSGPDLTAANFQWQ